MIVKGASRRRTFKFDGFENKSLFREVKEGILACESAMPGWLEHVRVFYDTNAERGDWCACSTRKAYLEATIYINPEFSALKEQHKRWVLLHEVCHILTWDLVGWTRRNLLHDEAGTASEIERLTREYNNQMEETTQALHYTLGKILWNESCPHDYKSKPTPKGKDNA